MRTGVGPARDKGPRKGTRKKPAGPPKSTDVHTYI